MTFDPHIDLGNILTLVTMLATFWKFHQTNVVKINRIELQVGLMWKRFAKKFDLPEDLEEKEEGE